MDVLTIVKGVFLTETLVNALRSWGIFDPIRNRIKARSQFLNRLLSCFECTSVWAGAVVVGYLTFCEVELITYLFIFHRLACFLHLGWEYLDACRAVKEGQI